MFAIQSGNLYWVDTLIDASDWSSDPAKAKRWAVRKIPDAIIACWNRACYEYQEEFVGVEVMNSLSVVELP